MQKGLCEQGLCGLFLVLASNDFVSTTACEYTLLLNGFIVARTVGVTNIISFYFARV